MRRVLLATLALAIASPAAAADKPRPAVPVVPVVPAVPAVPDQAIDDAAPAAAADKNQGFSLTMDEVRTLVFKAPIATVYVGNPAIADITMIDARHAFVLGKTFGRTNIVALNHDGVQVYNARISVAQGGTETLTLNRGVQRVTYNCTGARCEPLPTPGDSKDAFDTINTQLGAHTADARKAAGGN